MVSNNILNNKNIISYSSGTYTFCSKINGSFSRPEIVYEKYCTKYKHDDFFNSVIYKKPILKRSKSIIIIKDDNDNLNEENNDISNKENNDIFNKNIQNENSNNIINNIFGMFSSKDDSFNLKSSNNNPNISNYLNIN